MKKISAEETIHSEDDTFRILARPDIHKMVILHKVWKRQHRAIPYPSTENLKWAKYYGWNWAEYLRAKKAAGYQYGN